MYSRTLLRNYSPISDFAFHVISFQVTPSRFSFHFEGFCSSAQNFARCRFSATASGFLQIPHHDGHPYLRLTLPATKRAINLHTKLSPTLNTLMQNSTARPPRQAVLFCIIFWDFPYLLNVLLTFILLELNERKRKIRYKRKR